MTKINTTLAPYHLGARVRKYGADGGESYIKSRGVEAERKYINLLGVTVSLNSYDESFVACGSYGREHKSRLHYLGICIKLDFGIGFQ